MKEELGSGVMTNFVALRSKAYAYRELSGKELKKCKGVKKCVIRETLRYDDYVKCLFNRENIYRKQMTFKSDKHEINTIETNKIALNSEDDKRVVCKDQINTLARGHYKLC